jgi:hypothetical protein
MRPGGTCLRRALNSVGRRVQPDLGRRQSRWSLADPCRPRRGLRVQPRDGGGTGAALGLGEKGSGAGGVHETGVPVPHDPASLSSPPVSSRPSPRSRHPRPAGATSGVGRDVADVIGAETGADVSRFPTLGTSPRGPGSSQDSTSRGSDANPDTPY